MQVGVGEAPAPATAVATAAVGSFGGVEGVEVDGDGLDCFFI